MDFAGGLLEMEESYGWDCCIDAAAFCYAKGMLHTLERPVGLETDTSAIANECLRTVKKFGNKGITFRGTRLAPVQHYWQDLHKKLEDDSFDPFFVITHHFDISKVKELGVSQLGADVRKESTGAEREQQKHKRAWCD
ncbi:hypothetical protein AURDEDRAFT_171543 [Auricularia subglabra TFB-10046 SS5]|nr:hypothetical protein AURDEDRAFT_171543 [Auricularia subglabra TFB-10046 SS5]